MKEVSKICIAVMALGIVYFERLEAAVLNVDWKESGDGLAILDTTSNMVWLDLTVTANLSMNYVSGQLGTGGEFEGWRFATAAEVHSLLVSAGVTHFDWYTSNVAIVEQLFKIWGELGKTSYPRSARASYFNYVPQPDGLVAGAIGIGTPSWHWGEGYASEFGIRSFDLATWVTLSDPLRANALIFIPEPCTLFLCALGGLALRFKRA